MRVAITKSFTFDSAHKLLNYKGKCSNLHGHTYKLEVTVSGHVPEWEDEFASDPAVNYMVMDFAELKRIVKEEVVDKFDHHYLNDIFDQPTAEIMTSYIFKCLEKKLPYGVKLESVRLWETPDSYAECRGEKQ